MDHHPSHPFDALARRAVLPRFRSRRGVLGLLGAGLLGGLPSPALPTSANGAGAERCVHLGRRCQRGLRCCGGGICRGKRCRCPAGWERSGDRCLVP